MMLSRNLEKAKQAFREKNTALSKEAHETKERAYHKNEQGAFLKSFIYGGLDGIITTFAVVTGVTGAAFPPKVAITLGLANLIADGISMATGDYLSTKAENQYKKKERDREAWEVENFPEGEKKEMREIYLEKGFPAEKAEMLVGTLSENKEAWVDVMMREELGIIESNESPIKNAFVTFISFAIFGIIPLLAYILAKPIPIIAANTFSLACILTAVTLFLLGSLKFKITETKWYIGGFETLLVGGMAATASYFIGDLIAKIV